MKTHQRALSKTTITGLLVALVLPCVLSLVFNLIYQTSYSVGRIEWGIAAHLVNLGLLIGIVLLAEKCPLSSIGLSPLRWWNLPLGLVAGALISVAYPLIHMLMSRLAIGSNEAATAFLFSLPFFVRFILAITAGIFEETLFRGYAIERLTSILGNKWVAGLISVTLFTFAHFSFWGVAHMIPVFLIGVLVTLLYLWRRNLMVNIMAHITIDGIGFVLVPLLVHR